MMALRRLILALPLLGVASAHPQTAASPDTESDPDHCRLLPDFIRGRDVPPKSSWSSTYGEWDSHVGKFDHFSLVDSVCLLSLRSRRQRTAL